MPCPAYHSAESTVHHREPTCPSGAAIPPQFRLMGEGSKPICVVCKQIGWLDSTEARRSPDWA